MHCHLVEIKRRGGPFGEIPVPLAYPNRRALTIAFWRRESLTVIVKEQETVLRL